jgi:hypothetical protein
MPVTDAITAVANLLTKVFGFAVDPNGFSSMKVEHQVEVIHAGVKIAISKKDYDAIDMLFDEYRELCKTIGR